MSCWSIILIVNILPPQLMHVVPDLLRYFLQKRWFRKCQTTVMNSMKITSPGA